MRSVELGSLSNATFSLITWRSSSSKSAAVYKISSKSDDFFIAIWRHNDFHLQSLCCWPQLPVKFHVNLIHRSEDITVWIFRIFGLKCLFRSPKLGFWRTLDFLAKRSIVSSAIVIAILSAVCHLPSVCDVCAHHSQGKTSLGLFLGMALVTLT